MPSLAANTGEYVISRTGFHWIGYVFPAFLYAVLTMCGIALFLAAGTAAYHSPLLSYAAFGAALILVLGVHHWFFLVLLCESSSYIIVTNHRVIVLRDRLLLDEEMNEYAFDKMKTVSAYKKGFVQSILRYGTLRFESGQDIHYVPHPNRIARDIEQAMGLN